MVREVPDQNRYEAYRSLVLRYGSRDAHAENNAFLIKVMKFNFGDIDAMETKFEAPNLPIKEHDDISGIENFPDTIKRAILVAREPEPLRTHLQLNSQSYTTFLEMRQAINQYLKARKSFKLMERDDPMDADFVHKEGQKGKEKGNDKGKGKPKGKSKGKGKQNEKGKSSRKDKSNQEKIQGICRNCGKTGHKWSECWAKVGGAAKQANNVGETEETGDVNWIMMVQNLSVGQSSTSEIETWRCSGTSVSCKSAQESQVFIHAESDRVVPNSNVALHVAESSSTQQSTVDRTHQPDIRPESANPVNPVILSNTAELVVDSGCFDHCCPLEFATHSELKEGRFLNASAAKKVKLKHYGTRVVKGWTRDVNGTEIPLKIRFNVHCCRRASCENTDTQSCWTNSRQSRKTAPRSR